VSLVPSRLFTRSALLSRLSRLLNGPLSRLRYKVAVTLLAMLAYVLVGAALASHLPFDPETRAPLSFDEAVWWAWSHLIDPGFISLDERPLTRRVVGSLFAVGGLMMIAGALLAVISELAKVGVSRVVDGYLPRGLAAHTVCVGPAASLRPLLESAGRIWGEERLGDMVCVVQSTEELLSLRKTVERDMFITRLPLQDEDALVKLSLATAARVVLLEGAAPTLGDLIGLLGRVQAARAARVAEEARSAQARRRPLAPLQVVIEVTSLDQELVLSRLLDHRALHAARVSVRALNADAVASRIALKRYPLDHLPLAPGGVGVALVVYGWTRFAQSFVAQVVRSGHYLAHPTRLLVVGESAAEREAAAGLLSHRRHLRSNPYLSGLFTIEHFATELEALEALREHAGPCSALCADERPDVALARALRLTEHAEMLDLRPQVYLELSDVSGYQRLVKASGLRVVGSHAEAFERLDALDAPACALHQRYISQREESGQRARGANGEYLYEGDLDWEDLSPTRREWNRSAIDHYDIKARTLADLLGVERGVERGVEGAGGGPRCAAPLYEAMRALVRAFEDDPAAPQPHLERLAAIEHNRKALERALDGWRYGPQKDSARKHNPSLRPYEELTEEQRRYDREAIVEVFRFLCAPRGDGGMVKPS